MGIIAFIKRKLNIGDLSLTKEERQLIRKNKNKLQEFAKSKKEITGYIDFMGNISEITLRIGTEDSVRPEIQLHGCVIAFHTHPVGTIPDPSENDQMVAENLKKDQQKYEHDWPLPRLKHMVVTTNEILVYSTKKQKNSKLPVYRKYSWDEI